MPDKTRTYRMQRRAHSQEQTRLRITESAVALHGSVGPAHTSISAVAEHAGVRRSTVYRHFQDEAALFAACSAHWLAANPRPSLDDWSEVADPDERLLVALSQLYAFYGRTERMLENLLRDESTSSVVRERFSGFHGYVKAARETLMTGRNLRGAARRRTQAALGHAIAFSTWKSLVREQRLTNAQAVSLVRGLVSSAN